MVELEIDASRDKVIELFIDPKNNTKWMDDLERYEPIRGDPRMPGSTYRLVPKKGNMIFVATVIARELPNEFRLRLDDSNITVFVKGTFVALSPQKTRLTSEEVFRFKGVFQKTFGFLASSSIKQVHRRHIEAFKRFAETEAS